MVHGKSPSVGWSYGDMAKVINRFRSLAALLVDLHLIHNNRVPAVIIRSAFAPDVLVVELD